MENKDQSNENQDNQTTKPEATQEEKQANDRERLKAYAFLISEVERPTMETEIGQTIANAMSDQLENIVKFLNDNIEKV